MSYTYASFTTALSNTMQIDPANADFIVMEPSAIDYAELRIYRELDLLSTVTTNTSVSTTPGTRIIQYPQGTFVTFQDIIIITPAGVSTPDSGTRVPLTATSKEALDALWPSAAGQGVPQWFAMRDERTILLGPWPDSAYMVEARGTIRPAPLSASNTTTFLSLYLPDLFFCASMIFASGWMRNFGQQADDPRMTQSWETQYEALVSSATTEEMRKKFMGPAWTSQSPSQIATPPQR